MDEEEKESTAVEKYFFSPIYYPKDAWSVIRWWEARRPIYNLAVGTAGLASLGIVFLAEMGLGGTPPDMPFWPLPIIAVYGIAANICYSLGAPMDLLLRKFLGERAPAVSSALFRHGFVFSLGLTLLPIPVAIFSFVMRLIFR